METLLSHNPLPSHWPHRFALLTAIATVPLLFMGGLVTSTNSGMAVPDWPTTFGENMFLYPWSKMVGGIFYEHSHRLFGSLVGFLTILLAISLWIKEERQWLRWLGLVALGGVVVQGVLGGLRVTLVKLDLAIVHACFAQAFFALIASLVLFTSVEWSTPVTQQTTSDAGRVQHLGILTTGLIYIQLIFGAILRHRGEGDFFHIAGAVLVSIHVILLVARVRRNYLHLPVLAGSVRFLRNLLIVQLLLGISAYLGKFTQTGVSLNPFVVPLATMHVVIGALMLITSLIFTLRSYRLLLSPTLGLQHSQELSK
jgi:cytochrome c oxidase assembly protein subunit 15